MVCVSGAQSNAAYRWLSALAAKTRKGKLVLKDAGMDASASFSSCVHSCIRSVATPQFVHKWARPKLGSGSWHDAMHFPLAFQDATFGCCLQRIMSRRLDIQDGAADLIIKKSTNIWEAKPTQIAVDRVGAQKLLGVCPQHDVLWDVLKPTEHLYLFGLFKACMGLVLWIAFLHLVCEGVPQRELDEEVKTMLNRVRLFGNDGERLACQLSGGKCNSRCWQNLQPAAVMMDDTDDS
eukprot:2874338-Amphidinium_carterae.1